MALSRLPSIAVAGKAPATQDTRSISRSRNAGRGVERRQNAWRSLDGGALARERGTFKALPPFLGAPTAPSVDGRLTTIGALGNWGLCGSFGRAGLEPRPFVSYCGSSSSPAAAARRASWCVGPGWGGMRGVRGAIVNNLGRGHVRCSSKAWHSSVLKRTLRSLKNRSPGARFVVREWRNWQTH